MRGPYVPHDPNLPAYGLGEEDAVQVGFADEILREMLGGLPVGTYVPWAKQIGDTAWSELPQDRSLTCIPITQSMLDEVRGMSVGHEVIWVGILFDRPATFNAIERALYGSPYAFDSSQAVYDPNYVGEVPRIRFLVWARLRDSFADPKDQPGYGTDGAGGGRASMDVAAAALGGQLVYVIQGPVLAGSKQPMADFDEVLSAQLMQSGPAEPTPALPMVPPNGQEVVPVVAPPATAAVGPVQTATSISKPKSSNAGLAMVVLGAGAAALGLWWYSQRKQRSTGSSARSY